MRTEKFYCAGTADRFILCRYIAPSPSFRCARLRCFDALTFLLLDSLTTASSRVRPAWVPDQFVRGVRFAPVVRGAGASPLVIPCAAWTAPTHGTFPRSYHTERAAAGPKPGRTRVEFLGPRTGRVTFTTGGRRRWRPDGPCRPAPREGRPRGRGPCVGYLGSEGRGGRGGSTRASPSLPLHGQDTVPGL